MRNFRHLHLFCFASSAELPQPYGFHITVLSTNLLFALSKLCTPIIKRNVYTLELLLVLQLIPDTASYFLLMVEVGGFAPPSRTLFSLLHTAITNI